MKIVALQNTYKTFLLHYRYWREHGGWFGILRQSLLGRWNYY